MKKYVVALESGDYSVVEESRAGTVIARGTSLAAANAVARAMNLAAEADAVQQTAEIPSYVVMYEASLNFGDKGYKREVGQCSYPSLEAATVKIKERMSERADGHSWVVAKVVRRVEPIANVNVVDLE